MAQRLNQLAQQYEVYGGTLEIKLRTEHALTVEELEHFRPIAEAAESYAEQRPPESPGAKAERLAAQARAEEWRQE
jgi:hypothetical protein